MIIIYIRTADASRESLERQCTVIGAWEDLSAQPLHLTYIDQNCSGLTLPMEREQFPMALSMLRAGDTLLVADLSRISRNAVDLAFVKSNLRERGISLAVAGSQPID